MRGCSHLCLVAALSAACGPSSSADDDDDGPGTDGGTGADAFEWPDPNEFADAAPQEVCDKMDIMFVIDNSGSMSEEQGNLATNFPLFVNVLDSFVSEGGAPIDYRLALTSTGVSKSWTIEPIPGFPIPETQAGDDGAMLQRCTMTRRWFEKGDPDVATTFGCAAALGTDGPASEMPMAAMKMAFDERMVDGTNQGFRREDALLAIVVLTDENDCSREDDGFTLGFAEDVCTAVEPAATYKQFLDTYSGGAGRWAIAVIAGPGPGACSSTFGSADESTRLIELAGMAGANGVVSSICEGDLASALGQALSTFDTACDELPPIE